MGGERDAVCLFAVAQGGVHDFDHGHGGGILIHDLCIDVLFVGLDEFAVFDEEIDVVKAIHEAMFLVIVDLKVSALVGGE